MSKEIQRIKSISAVSNNLSNLDRVGSMGDIKKMFNNIINPRSFDPHQRSRGMSDNINITQRQRESLLMLRDMA